MLEVVSQWDPNAVTLDNEEVTVRFTDPYKNLGDLFEQKLSDICWLQHAGQLENLTSLTQFNIQALFSAISKRRMEERFSIASEPIVPFAVH